MEIYIPENEYITENGYLTMNDIVSLLRKYKNNPRAIEFIADMLED